MLLGLLPLIAHPTSWYKKGIQEEIFDLAATPHSRQAVFLLYELLMRFWRLCHFWIHLIFVLLEEAHRRP
jgi:hypothetical protein